MQIAGKLYPGQSRKHEGEVLLVQHIHILGASGSGTSTLGGDLAETLSFTHFDTDDYYWETKFSKARPVAQRLDLLRKGLASRDTWVLSGSLVGWGDPLIDLFDLVVFLRIPKELRMKRLRIREEQRYGRDILPGGPVHQESLAFLQWAEGYDDGDMNIRSLKLHLSWLDNLPCPVLRLEGDCSRQARCDSVIQEMRKRLARV